MDEQYIQDLWNWTTSQDPTFKDRYTFDSWKEKIGTDEVYQDQFHSWVSSQDDTFSERRPLDQWKSLVKKKEDTVSVLEDGSSGLQEPSVQVEEEQIDFDPTAGVTAIEETGVLPTPPPRDFTQPFLGPVGMDDPMSVEEQQELLNRYSGVEPEKPKPTMVEEESVIQSPFGSRMGGGKLKLPSKEVTQKYEQEKTKRDLTRDKDRKIGYVLNNLDENEGVALFQNLASTRGEIADDELQQMVDVVDKKIIDNYGQEEYDLVQKIGGNVTPKDLFYGGNISTSPSVVDELVVEGDETATVTNLNNQFDGTPFTFSKSILGSDAVEVSVTTPDGLSIINSKIVRIDDGAKASQQLRDFMAKSNLSKGNKEFLSEGKINGKDTSNLPIDQQRLANYKYMLENKDKFSAGKGGFLPSNFAIDANEIMNFVEEHPNFFPPEEMQSIKVQLDAALSDQYKEDEQLEGSAPSSFAKSFMSGYLQRLKFGGNLAIDIGAGFTPDYFKPVNSFNAINFDKNGNRLSESEVVDKIKKRTKRKYIASMDNALEDTFTGTTKAWQNSEERNDISRGLDFLFESIGVSAGMPNRLAQGLSFFAYAANGIEDEMAGTEYDGLSEWKKKLISFPYGIMIGALENLGWEASTGSFGNPVFEKISRNIITRVMKSIPKNASQEVIKTAIENSTKAAVADGTIRFISGALSESFVEGTQEFADVGLKNVVNAIMEKDYFANAPDLTTVKGWQETTKQAKEAAKYGFIAGSGAAGGGGLIQAGRNRLRRDADIREYNEQKEQHTNETQRKKLIFNITNAQRQGEITAEQAEAAKEQVAEDAATYEQIPDEGLSNKNKIESFALITERNNLEKEIAGKNEELVTKQRDRIRDINSQLTIIGTQDATTEQESSDLDEDQQAEDVQEMEEGTPLPESEEATDEEVEVEEGVELTEEQLADQEVLDLEAAIEGEVKEGRVLPSQTTITEEVTTEEAPVAETVVEEDVTTEEAPTKTKVDGVVMSDKKRSKKEQALVDRAKRAAKALTKIGKGGVTVEVHDDTDSFKKVTGQDGRGAYDKTSNTIHINLSKANNTTVAHEAFHAVLLQKVSNTADVTKTMFDAVRKAGKGDTRAMQYTTTKEVDGKTETVTETATVEEYLEDFASNYEENVQDEEKLAELTGLLASSYVNLAPAPKSKVRQWVDKVMTPIAEKLGIKVDQFTKTDQGVVDLLNAISAKVTIGEEIQEGDVKVLEEIETKPETKKKGKTKKISWTKKQSKPQGESTQKTKEVQAKIRDLVKRYEGGEITIEEYNKQADDIIPVRMKEVFVDPVTQEELMVGLKSKNTQTNSPIKEGADVSLRIDIPFMKRTGKASVTIHERKSPKDITGRVLSYRGSAVIKDVEFLVNPKQSLAFATDNKVHKSSNLGRMGGKLVDIGKTIEEQNEAAKKLSQQAIDEGWTQVGINPAKHSYFYDRSNGKPLKSADRVVQVGDLIYAENAKTTTIYDDRFIVKGKTDKKGGPLRFQKEGVELIAPNGKPSNLTEEQYKLVRTPAFKNWFGDWESDPENASKIVDENGEPQVVYHGTFKEFEAFDKSKGGTNTVSVEAMPRNNWFWFSNNEDISSSFGSNILPVFLNVRNPQISEGAKLAAAYTDALRLKKDGIIAEEVDDSRRTSQSLEVKGEEDVELISIEDRDFTGSLRSEIEGGESVEEMIALLDEYIEYSKGEVRQYREEYPQDAEYRETQMDQARRMINAFKKYGRDGVKVGEPIKGDVIAIEKSNQAKLADGSNKTFDPQDKRIRFQKEGVSVSEDAQTEPFKGGKFVESPADGLMRRQVGGFEVTYVEQDRMADLMKEGLVTQPKDLSDFADNYVAITAPDDMLAGQISYKGKPIFDGGGGVFFTTKYGDVWASGNRQTAETLTKIINESVKRNNGKGYLVLAKGTDSKLVSSVSGVESSLAILDIMLDEGMVSPSDFRRAVSEAVRKNGGSISLRKSAKELKKDVTDYFNDPKTSTFDKRGNVVKDLIGNLAKSKSLKENKAEILDLLGGDKSKGLGAGVTPKSQSLVDLVAKVAAEQVTKGLKVGDIYAVIEVDGDVEVKEDSHPSYPFHVVSKTKSKPILHLPQDRQAGKNILTSSSGKPYSVDVVSVKSGTFNDASTMTSDLSETAMREQKSLMQIGRYYNANNQGFFPSQVNSYQLKQDLEQIGFGLKRAKNGAYYATRGGRKVNPFPPEPSRYRFQRDDIGIVEEKSFTSKNTVADIIIAARREGFKDKAIRFYILKRRSDIKEENGKPLRAKTVDDMLRLPANILENVPDSFKEIEGGAAAGLRLYQKVEQLRDKLLAANARIKSPKLSDAGIKQKIKEKREELKKKKLSKEQLAKELDAFTKREYKNNKARKEMKTESEIMDEVIEFLEKQPEYIEAGDKGKKTPSLLQSKMQAELQATIAFRPSREVAQNLSKLKNRARAMDKAGRDLQEIKRQLRATLRKSLPQTEYSKPEVMRLLGEIAKVDASNLQDVIGEIESLIVKKNVQILEAQIDKLLGTKVTKSEAGRRKGKFGYDEAARLEAINNNIVKNKKVNRKVVKYTAEEIMDKNEKLRRQFNEIMRNPEGLSIENIDILTDLQIAININSANLMKAQLETKERISPNIIAPLVSAQESLQELIEEGRSKFKAELQEAHEEYQRQFAVLWEEMTGQKLDMSDPEVQKTINEKIKEKESKESIDAKKNKFRKLATKTMDSIVLAFDRTSALFQLMDKISIMPGDLAGGRIQEEITDRVNESSRIYKGRMLVIEKSVELKMEEVFGKKWRKKTTELNKKTIPFKTTERNETISQNQLAYLYNQYKDPANAGSFETMFGQEKILKTDSKEEQERKKKINKDFTKQKMDELISQLDPQLKEWADWQVDEFFPSVYEYYNDTYRKIYRTDMPWNEFYAGRIYRDGIVDEPLDLLANASILRTSVGAASTLERKQNTKPITAMNINNTLTSYIQDMEYFAAYAETIRDIDKMFTNENTTKFLKSRYGNDINDLIKNSIQKIAGKGQQKFKMARFINWSTNAFIFSRLAINPVVFIKQLTSIPTYANDIGFANWIKYSKIGTTFSERRTRIKQDYDEIIENSVYLADRAKGLSIRDAISNYAKDDSNFINKETGEGIKRLAMGLTKAGDKAAILLGGLPNYRYYKAQYKKQNPKATEQEVIDYAIRKFERDTKNTQQSSDLQDRDYYQTDDGLMRAFNMFMTTPKQYLRKEIVAFRNLGRKIKARDSKAGKGTIGENIRQIALYHVMMPALFQWATLGFPVDMDDEDERDMLRSMLLGNLNALFIVGDVATMFADYLTEKPWAGNADTLPILSQSARLIKVLQKWDQKANAANPKPNEVEEAQAEFYRTLAEGVGIPANQLDKLLDNYTKLFTEDMSDAEKVRRILNYSNYVIEGKKDDKKKKKDSDGKRTKAEQKKFERELKNYNPDAYRSMGYEERDRLEEQLKMSEDPSIEMEKKRQKEELDRLNREIYQSYN